jgi:hypothetical protein
MRWHKVRPSLVTLVTRTVEQCLSMSSWDGSIDQARPAFAKFWLGLDLAAFIPRGIKSTNRHSVCLCIGRKCVCGTCGEPGTTAGRDGWSLIRDGDDAFDQMQWMGARWITKELCAQLTASLLLVKIQDACDGIEQRVCADRANIISN